MEQQLGPPIGQTAPPPVAAPPPAGWRGWGGTPVVAGVLGGVVLGALLIVPGLVRGLAGGGFAGPGLLLPLVVISGLIWLAIWAVPRLAHPDEALELLRERYARGEVAQADYVRMWETLTHGRR